MRHGVSNFWQSDCLFNKLFRLIKMENWFSLWRKHSLPLDSHHKDILRRKTIIYPSMLAFRHIEYPVENTAIYFYASISCNALRPEQMVDTDYTCVVWKYVFSILFNFHQPVTTRSCSLLHTVHWRHHLQRRSIWRQCVQSQQQLCNCKCTFLSVTVWNA